MSSKGVRYVLWVFAAVLSLGMISPPVRAQVSGATLSGAITDAQGGAVSGAKVSARNVGTGLSTDTTTNESGSYSLPNLTPADYEVSVTATGFSTTVSKVTLTVGAKQEMNLSLTVGQMTQQVEVTGAAPQVELESSTVSGNVQSTEIRELPLNGRDWASLATLEPGVIGVRTQRDFTQVGAGGRGLGTQMSVGGGRPTQNSYRLDGALVNDYSNAGPGSVLGANLGVDAIQEFTVLTSNYSAEYGFTSGGVINAITKSGTNTFHGSGFDFVRNSALDARNFFTKTPVLLAKDELQQNQFGASAGWRILKDKAFLFGAYEGVRRLRGLPIVTTTTISDAVRAGNVTNLTTGAVVNVPVIDPNIQKYLPLYLHPAAGAGGCITLPASQFSAPGVHGGCNPNIGFAPFIGHQHASEDFVTGRGDYKLTSKDDLYGTYVRDKSFVTTPMPYNTELQQLNSYRQAIIAEDTHVFNASWVNSFRVAEDRTNNQGGLTPIGLNPAATDTSLGMQAPYSIYQGTNAGITITGSGTTGLPAGVGGGASNQQFWGQLFQIYDDAFWSHGNHSIKFGGAFFFYQLNIFSPLVGVNGNATYTNQGLEPCLGVAPACPSASSQTVATAAEGNGGTNCYKGSGDSTNGNNFDASCGSLVNFLTNQPRNATTTYDSAAIYKHYWRDKIPAFYIQDDWRVRPSFTLNIGLRYEMSTIPTHLDNLGWTLPSITTPIPCGPAVANQCPQPGIPSSVAGPDPTSVLKKQIYARNPTTLNFEPRFGFAWDPFHNGKTSVRGGFGVFDSLPLPYIFALFNTQSVPFTTTLATEGSVVLPSPPSIAGCSNPNATAQNCSANTAGEWPYVTPTIANVHNVNPNGRTFIYFDNNIKRNYIYQYNFNIQRQLGPNLTLLVGYAGSRGIHNVIEDDSMDTVRPTIALNGDAVWPCPATIANPAPPPAPARIPSPTPGCFVDSPWIGSLSTFQAASFMINPTTGNGGMRGIFWESSSWYNAMQIKLDKRMSHGFQIEGAFTWSKSIDDASGSSSPNSFALDLSSPPPYNNAWIKGLSDFDVRKNLVINALWNAPTPHYNNVLNHVLGGWQLGVIASMANGVPFWLNDGTDLLGENGATSTDPPFLFPGCSAQGLTNTNYRNSLFYVNANCLSLVPKTATNAPYCDSTLRGFSAGLASTVCANIRGNLGRNTIIGPGLADVDFSIFKNNYIPKISEAFNVQFRAEFFDILNRTNLAPPPVANLSVFNAQGVPSSTMGQITSTQHDNREIQLALKINW